MNLNERGHLRIAAGNKGKKVQRYRISREKPCMKKAYLRPQTDIESMEPETLMDFGMSGNGDGTGLEPQSREGYGQLWDDEDDTH